MTKKRYPRLFGLLPLFGMLLLGGCNMTLLDPVGQVGIDEKNLIITATLLMLLVVVPVILMTIIFAWKYRASNKNATYAPKWSHSTKIEVVIWTVPILIIIALGVITYKSTHALDPYRPIQSDVKPVTIEVVAMDWKWLFIYPDQGIATVNKIVFPANTPVNFRITSDTVMNSFFIPGLGGQIYAMAGMTTKLHLIANKNAELDGISANYSGAGFTGMKFKAIATSQADFDAWVSEVKASPKQLDTAEYAALTKPSQNNPVELYSSYAPNLFQTIIDKYEGMKPGKPVNHEKKEVAGTEGLDTSSHSAAGAEE
ncbi:MULTISPECIES: ubiquinol oxidase subunit II [Pseudomonas]|jgi:cytochrome o ubiquinol oxidase subunit II|uniref:Ubiquinol oxidase subunit 2 n=1 Tax=Pseudomonas weihenstephanensis TaxID=1608994 RepID=A0A0J6IUD3_9PSED|nr:MULTISPECIES: ubiquinol oxidase subunit II [Pseudomonas]KMN15517.1 ubiquinol oxidase subunit II [Pseudomonas weihenstephanensis]KMN17990.1 ubiquinol oxidase subunit II [Pseudomonas weihenstephanensis]KVV01944.1 Ubiquinol oxidase subunit 2 precursor [Pseudomonas sp. TAD18]KVV03514.1 Ubiquinol oxidase subunit 2 precursor [Pseudomonas sp. TAA207]MBM1190369.1 ubiquinol oxidase subunit II [Pseudomonas weihenstephanensis]